MAVPVWGQGVTATPSAPTTPRGVPVWGSSAATTDSGVPTKTIVVGTPKSLGGGGGPFGWLESGAEAVQHGAAALGTGVYNFIRSSQVPQAAWNVSPASFLYNYAASGGNANAAMQASAHGLNQALFGGSPSRVASQWGQFLNPVTTLAEVRGEYKTDPFVKMTIDQYAPFRHPLRDPAQTALALGLIVLPAEFSTAARLSYLGSITRAMKVTDEAGRFGGYVREGSPAASEARQAGHTLTPLTEAEKHSLRMKLLNPLRTPPTAPRLVYKHGLEAPALPLTPRFMVSPSGVAQRIGAEIPKEVAGLPIQGPANLTSEAFNLMKSGSHFVRNALQAPLDALIQRGFDRSFMAPGGRIGLLGKYATARGRAVLDEAGRLQINQLNTLSNQVEQEAKNLDPNVSKEEARLATFFRSGNVDPKEGVTYWGTKAEDTPEAKALADTSRSIDEKGLMRVGANGKMEINSAAFPRLAYVDSLAKQAQDLRENIIRKYDLLPAHILEERKSLVAERMGSEQARNPVTGVREGDAYTSLRTSVPRGGRRGYIKARVASTVSTPKSFIFDVPATGRGIEKGIIPEDTYKSIAQSLNEALRYMNTVGYRGQLSKYGSFIRTRKDEVLVRDPNQGGGVIPPFYRELMDESKTLTSDGKPSHEGLMRGIAAKIEEEIPGLRDKFASNLSTEIGMRAPNGFVWVPKSMLGDLTKIIPVERNKVEKFFDAINSGITAATVYARPGHLATRALTNATTNLIQGSFAPKELAASAEMVQKLGGMYSQRVRELAAATGAHSTQALPAKGTALIARGARRGAAWWAKRIDMPFRVHAVLYELRDVGVDTVPEIENVLAHLKNPDMSGMSNARKLEVDYALHRANRASIMYDGMSDAEREYIARYIWFLPWIQGGTRYAFHVAGEHPLKAWNTIQTGRQGQRQQEEAFPGGVPSLAFGITPVTGGVNPWTSNFESFTPFGQIGADVAMLRHPANPDEGFFGQLNPVFSGLFAGAGSAYQKQPFLKVVKHALEGTVAPTPEWNIINSTLNPPRAKQWYGSTDVGITNPYAAAFVSQLMRALAGAGVPRPTRAANLARSYVTENTPHHMISIPGK